MLKAKILPVTYIIYNFTFFSRGCFKIKGAQSKIKSQIADSRCGGDFPRRMFFYCGKAAFMV